MKILLVTVLSMFILGSCAHHHDKAGDHHMHKCKMKSCDMKHIEGEAFNKHCAMSVAMGDMHVEGKQEYKYDHGGEIYYFSTKEKMKKFKANIQKNLSKAKVNWAVDIRR